MQEDRNTKSIVLFYFAFLFMIAIINIVSNFKILDLVYLIVVCCCIIRYLLIIRNSKE